MTTQQAFFSLFLGGPCSVASRVQLQFSVLGVYNSSSSVNKLQMYARFSVVVCFLSVEPSRSLAS